MINVIEKMKLFNKKLQLITIFDGDEERSVKLYDKDFVVFTPAPDEILITPVDFQYAVDQHKFVSFSTASDDWFKRIGVTENGDTYVSEWCITSMPPDKETEYYKRKGVGKLRAKLRDMPETK